MASRLGYCFSTPGLLHQALAHRSWCAEVAGEKSNERLEFLGDAVLGWVVADVAYTTHDDLTEGRLTDLRKAVVNASALAEVAVELGLGEFLLLGKGEDAAGGRAKPSILSDALEAVIGAVYIDGGSAEAFDLIVRLLGHRVTGAGARDGMSDFKTLLQELAARGQHASPVYAIEQWGPDHAKSFRATVTVGGQALGVGEGRSKKQAEQIAARLAFAALQESVVAGTGSRHPSAGAPRA